MQSSPCRGHRDHPVSPLVDALEQSGWALQRVWAAGRKSNFSNPIDRDEEME